MCKGGVQMKVLIKKSVKNAVKELKENSTKKFTANETVSSCLCRCSDG